MSSKKPHLPKTHTKRLKVLVTGPTGTTGRAVVKNLLDRGHYVSGMSRDPQKWGTHPNYTPRKGSQTGNIDLLLEIVEGNDVVISAFAPSHSNGLETYAGLVEGAWRIKEAVKRAKSKPYLIYVGGAGSLRDQNTNLITLDEPTRLWPEYVFYGPIQHLDWLRGVINMTPMHIYYYVRDCARGRGFLSYLARMYSTRFEAMLIKAQKSEKQLTMPHACRANVSFFEHDTTFGWSFLSPPWFYRDGPGIGKYGTIKEYQPLDPKGRMLGINNGDLAMAISDEAEEQRKKWTHWSCFAKQMNTLEFYDNYKDVKFDRFELDQ